MATGITWPGPEDTSTLLSRWMERPRQRQTYLEQTQRLMLPRSLWFLLILEDSQLVYHRPKVNWDSIYIGFGSVCVLFDFFIGKLNLHPELDGHGFYFIVLSVLKVILWHCLET